MNSVLTKEENYKLYEAGAYGNKIRTWKNLEGLKASDFTGNVVIRYKVVDRPLSLRGVGVEHIDQYITELEAEGYNRELMTFNEMAPDQYLTIQGEVMLSPRHYTLTYSDVPTLMKLAFKQRRIYSEGVEAMMLLRRHMEPASYDDLQDIFDEHPDCIVEFSCYSITLGSCPRRNTVFWEVRSY